MKLANQRVADVVLVRCFLAIFFPFTFPSTARNPIMISLLCHGIAAEEKSFVPDMRVHSSYMTCQPNPNRGIETQLRSCSPKSGVR